MEATSWKSVFSELLVNIAAAWISVMLINPFVIGINIFILMLEVFFAIVFLYFAQILRK